MIRPSKAGSGPRAEGVSTKNQRGRGLGLCLLRGGLNKSRHKVPIALVRVQCTRKDLYKAVEGPRTVLSRIIGSYDRLRMRV